MPGSGIPILVQHLSSGYGVAAQAEFGYEMPNDILAGNCLIVGVQSSTSNTGFTMGGDITTGWLQVMNVVLNSQRFAVFVRPNCPAGARYVEANPNSGNPAFVSAQISEFCNIALTSPVDGSHSAADSAGPRTAGAFTPTVNGDLIWWWWADTNTENSERASFAPNVSGILLAANIQEGLGAAYVIQATAGSINPGMTTDGGDTFAVCAVALKAADAGTLPTASPRVIRRQHHGFRSAARTTYAMQFPCTGDLIVVRAVGAQGVVGNPTIASIADGNSNSYAQRARETVNASTAGVSEIWSADGATTGPGMTGPTLTLDNAPSGSFATNVILDDVEGGATFDAGNNANGIQQVTADLTVAPVTPSTAKGIAFNVTGINAHTCSGSVGTGFKFNAQKNSIADGADGTADSDNGYAQQDYNASGQISFVYSVQNNTAPNGVQEWSSASAAFTAQSGTIKSIADSGAGSDAIGVAAGLAVADAGVGADSMGAAISLIIADSGAGTEELLAGVRMAIAEAAAGLDSIGVSANVAILDSGAGNDQKAVAVSLALADAGAGADAVSVLKTVLIAIADAGLGSDSVGVSVSLLLADAGAGLEQLSIGALLSVMESAGGTDAIVKFDSIARIASITFALRSRLARFSLAARSIDFDLISRSMRFTLH